MMEEDKYAYTNYYADLLAVSHPDYDCKVTLYLIVLDKLTNL